MRITVSGKEDSSFPIRHVSVLAGLVILAVVFSRPVSAQLRCDLLPRNKPASGADSSCLDLLAAQNGGPPVLTANNATRLAQDGLRLCRNTFVQNSGGNADIVFIYDNSSSMDAGFLWVNPASGDTVFYVWERGCANSSITGSATYQTLEGPHTVEVLANGAGCDFYAGDPYRARGAVIRRAIDYVVANANSSTAGGIAFTNVTYHERPPQILNVAANVQTVKNSINILATVPGSGTNYRPPLDSAKRWLNHPSLRKTLKPAIVFISDGAPGDTIPYLDLVDANMPPVFSIFLGQVATPDTASLRQLSDLTGGRFYRVNPANVAEINRVMEEILRAILVSNRPSDMVVSNQSLVPPQISRPIRFTDHPDGSATLVLDSVIALRQGANNLVVTITGSTGPRNYPFVIQADGPASGSSSAQLRCYPLPTLALRNQQGGSDAAYPGGPTTYDVVLTRALSDLGAVQVKAVSGDAARPQPFGDTESLLLPSVEPTPTLATNILQDLSFNGAGYAPVANNRILEATPGGTVTLTWSHPRDPRESATFELPGRGSDLPSLDLYHGGRKLSVVNHDQYDLEIRLVFPSGDSCLDCRVRVQPSGSLDRELVVMAPAGGYRRGYFTRELNPIPSFGDQGLQHVAGDSIVLIFDNPLHPGEGVRRSYPFIPPPEVLRVGLHNNISRADPALHPADMHWVVAASPSLPGARLDPGNKCCRVLPWPLSPADSLGYLGFTVEASTPFAMKAWVYSTLGQFVGQVDLAIGEPEFNLLPQGGSDRTRVMKLLWSPRAADGGLAGTGTYILRTLVTLIPGGQASERTYRVGYLRTPQ